MPRCSYGVEMLKIIYNASALICVSITLGTFSNLCSLHVILLVYSGIQELLCWRRVIQCDIYILNLLNNIIIGINELYTRRQAEPMPRCSYGVEMLKIIYNASALICVSITLGTFFKFV